MSRSQGTSSLPDVLVAPVSSPSPFEVGAFTAAVQADSRVRATLSGHRVRLLQVVSGDDLDKDGDRDLSRESEAVFYDYTANRTVRVRGSAQRPGRLEMVESYEQPLPSWEEVEESFELVRQSPVWGPLIAAGHLRLTQPMPPLLQPSAGEPVERTLYVGLGSTERKFHRIVAVNMVRREVSVAPVVPRGSRGPASACGVEPAPCNPPRRGAFRKATVRWPKQDPVWQFQVTRPAGSSGWNGSGIELRNVSYKGWRVLKQAHVPILNVQYDRNFCGPYRDWLWQESCFEAVGEDIGSDTGIRLCTQPARTVLESNQDGGNFTGVAIYEAQDESLRVVTQCEAGWYRYIMEWHFFKDGTLRPRFRFGAAESSCVCRVHNHHAYWRLDFDILNTANVVEVNQGGNWTPILTETSTTRVANELLAWRVRHATKKRNGQPFGYEIIPGIDDAVGDAFSGPDQYVLRYHRGVVDDGRRDVSDAPSVLNTQVNGEKTGPSADVVVWYAAHFVHEQDPEGISHPRHNVDLGPTLRPFNWR